MPSAGKGAFLGVILFFIIYYIKRPVELLKSIVSLLIIFAFFFVIYITIIYLKDKSIKETLELVFSVAVVDFTVGSYTTIFNRISLLAIFYYTITPLIFLTFCIYIIKLRWNLESLKPNLIIALAIATTSIFVHIRGLARHSLVEAYCANFIFILIFLILGSDIFKKHIYKLWCAAGLLIIVLSPQLTINSINNLTIKSYQWDSPRPSRVDVAATNEINQITDLLKTNLNHNETFLEIINGHLLYVLSEKRMPFFHSSFQLIQSAKPQNIYIKQIADLYNTNQIPLLIMNSDFFFGAKIDKIPSTQSLFLLSEFLYGLYEPWKKVGGFEIWAAKNSRFIKNDLENPKLYISQQYDFEKLPFIWGKSKEFSKILPPSDSLDLTDLSNTNLIHRDKLTFLENGRYLLFSIASNHDGELVITASNKEASGSIAISFDKSVLPNYYIIPIKSLYIEQFNPEYYEFKSSRRIDLYL
jgi:hypothetical protein